MGIIMKTHQENVTFMVLKVSSRMPGRREGSIAL